ADRNRSHWSTSKTPSYTKSVSWHHHPVFGGDFIMDDLKKVKNTEAWVWYKNCDSKNKNVAVELLQIYELHQ
ncbi:hypothetical protein, partial [Escherichia coli]|uniref:hypothetical protein n=1 Tax=Escherichia coli TaxID=562 RepID=UPI00215836CF